MELYVDDPWWCGVEWITEVELSGVVRLCACGGVELCGGVGCGCVWWSGVEWSVVVRCGCLWWNGVEWSLKCMLVAELDMHACGVRCRNLRWSGRVE